MSISDAFPEGTSVEDMSFIEFLNIMQEREVNAQSADERARIHFELLVLLVGLEKQLKKINGSILELMYSEIDRIEDKAKIASAFYVYGILQSQLSNMNIEVSIIQKDKEETEKDTKIVVEIKPEASDDIEKDIDLGLPEGFSIDSID